MTLRRFFCCPIKSGLIELLDSEAHYAIHVLRVIAGQAVELFDGNGAIAKGEITQVFSKKVEINVQDIQFIGPSRSGKVVIAASVPKGERFEWLITKATELGVDRLIPVVCERTVKQPKNMNTAERYRRLAIAAAKQSGVSVLPIIDSPLYLGEALLLVEEEYRDALKVFGSPDSGAMPLVQVESRFMVAVGFVGPEGGFTDKEEELLKEAGVLPVRLTRSILRVETAALSFAALLTCRRDAAE